MQQDKQFQLLRLASFVSFLFALVNHLLPPKAFSATQLMFDYEFGMTRRGLAGEILNLFTGSSVSISEIYTAAAVLTLFGAGAFYLFLSRQMPQQVSAYLVLILALNSFAFSSFVGNSGYLDAALLAMTVLALLSDGATTRGLLLRLGLCVLGALFHENMLPYFTVLIGLDLWLARRGTRFALGVALTPVLAALLAVVFLTVFGSFTAMEAGRYAVYLQTKADFGLDPTSTEVASRGIAQNFALMAELHGTTKYWAWVLFDGVPLLGMSLWLIWLALRLLGNADFLTRLILAGAVMAPLSLNIIAFDVVRFGAASVLTGFMVLVLLMRYIPDAAKRLERSLNWPLFTLLLVLNANIFTIEVNTDAGHTSQFPWVLLSQLKWLTP
jgi:hypothetical protein